MDGHNGLVDLRRLLAKPAVRSYRDVPVPAETVEQIVAQARWTGSARNRQPWRFAAVYDSGMRGELSRLGAYAGHLATAPVVLVLLSPVDGFRDTEFDVGRMAQSITMVAASMSLGCCLASLYPEENSHRAAALVGAEPGWAARHAIALGHAGRPRVTGRRVLPRGRHDTAEILRFW